MDERAISIAIEGAPAVSGLLAVPTEARACAVLAHGAGAGMHHRSMAALAEGLAAREVATLRYQFPYMEQGSKRPDRPAVAHRTVRAAVAAAASHLPGVPLVAGGRSFGGRMTSQAQADERLPGVRGLVFFGFPLHPAGQPATTRAEHLAAVTIPMLFVQGTRDALADLSLLVPVIERLGPRATLLRVEDGDHGFHVPARSGRRDADVLDAALDAVAAWIGVLSAP